MNKYTINGKHMDTFHYCNDELYIDNIPLGKIAEQYGTPCYVYSKKSIETNWHRFNNAFADAPHLVCYAVKANSNLAVLNCLARLNSGFDIVSIGELERVLAAGGNPKHIIFSGVGKQAHEIQRALEVGIYCFNVESEAELDRIHDIAKQFNQIAPIALRVNPNIDAGTHPYIATGLKENKFGIDIDTVPSLCQRIKKLKHLQLIGIGHHIGSQLTDITPFLKAIDCLTQLIDLLKHEGFPLQMIDIGGGLGIRYRDETPPNIEDYAIAIQNKLNPYALKILIEPGRSIVGNAGVLLTKVEYLKHNHHKNFAVVDAGMNDLLRPALYEAWQNILPLKRTQAAAKCYDIVGPVCETADFLGKNRALSLVVNDLLAICSAGAYGFSMSSNYNSRPRPAEILVDDHQALLIRERETIHDLFKCEKIIS